MTRILRCAACARRIKPHHPHIGVEDLGTSGYEVREDVLHLPTASPATVKLVKGA